MTEKHTKIIVTLGPATNDERALRQIKARGVDFVRVNMSHSSLEDLEYFIGLSRKVGIPFIIDTEGSQIRTGDLQQNTVQFKENERVELHANPIAAVAPEVGQAGDEVAGDTLVFLALLAVGEEFLELIDEHQQRFLRIGEQCFETLAHPVGRCPPFLHRLFDPVFAVRDADAGRHGDLHRERAERGAARLDGDRLPAADARVEFFGELLGQFCR